MNVDFTAILAVLAIVTGTIWAVDALFIKFSNTADTSVEKLKDETNTEEKEESIIAKISRLRAEFSHFLKTRTKPLLVELVNYIKRHRRAFFIELRRVSVESSRFLFPVFMVVLIVRGFLVEPFQIPSGSMLPTLENGDYILVNKFAYGIRLPLGYHKIIDLGRPQRGDVIVFRYPENTQIDYIKRVVGLPGDRLKYIGKVLYINDVPVKIKPLHPYAKDPRYMELEEQLDDVSHKVLHNPFDPGKALNTEVIVPENSYYVFGDNRDNSKDSRFWRFVPDENLKGRAFMIWFNKKDKTPVQWSRIGTIIE